MCLMIIILLTYSFAKVAAQPKDSCRIVVYLASITSVNTGRYSDIGHNWSFFVQVDIEGNAHAIRVPERGTTDLPFSDKPIPVNSYLHRGGKKQRSVLVSVFALEDDTKPLTGLPPFPPDRGLPRRSRNIGDDWVTGIKRITVDCLQQRKKVYKVTLIIDVPEKNGGNGREVAAGKIERAKFNFQVVVNP